MKKSLSIVLAVIFALAAIFALTALAFAENDTDTSSSSSAAESSTVETRSAAGRDDTSSSAKADESSSKADTSSSASQGLDQLESLISKLDTSTKATLPNTPTKDNAETVTNAPGVTAFVNDDTTAQATTKAAAPVNTYVPKTGSSYAIPAVAVLALLAGTVAVVAVKKNED